MKKQMIIILVSALFSCSKNDVAEPTEVLKGSNVITVDQALSSLYDVLGEIDDMGTKGGSPREIEDVNVLRGADISLTTKSSDMDNLVYLVNFSENNGFAVLSADKRIRAEVIAVTEIGNISVGDFTELPEVGIDNGRKLEPEEIVVNQINSYIKRESEVIKDLVDDGYYGGSSGNGGGGSSSSYPSKVRPLLTTKWHQGEPFNELVKPVKAGCITIAIGQIINYHRHVTNVTYDWDLMVNYDDSVLGEAEVAKFIRDIGILCGISYDSGKSSTIASAAKVKNVLEDMGYRNVKKYEFYKEDKMLNMLRKGNPVYISALSRWMLGEGHAWVIDGYIKRNGKYLFHCNYGWRGTCNGYYHSDVFDTTQGPVEVEEGEKIGTNGPGHYKNHYRTLTYDKP